MPWCLIFGVYIFVVFVFPSLLREAQFVGGIFGLEINLLGLGGNVLYMTLWHSSNMLGHIWNRIEVDAEFRVQVLIFVVLRWQEQVPLSKKNIMLARTQHLTLLNILKGQEQDLDNLIHQIFPVEISESYSILSCFIPKDCDKILGSLRFIKKTFNITTGKLGKKHWPGTEVNGGTFTSLATK
ncbi:hypothetical protein ACJX0J_037472 [Zea mays]